MNANVNIFIIKYDDVSKFVTAKRGDENLYMALGICQFIDEMEYWEIPVKGGKFNGELGHLFSQDIDEEDIIMEIERFVVHNNI